jgi:hypothetical protein
MIVQVHGPTRKNNGRPFGALHHANTDGGAHIHGTGQKLWIKGAAKQRLDLPLYGLGESTTQKIQLLGLGRQFRQRV